MVINFSSQWFLLFFEKGDENCCFPALEATFPTIVPWQNAPVSGRELVLKVIPKKKNFGEWWKVKLEINGRIPYKYVGTAPNWYFWLPIGSKTLWYY